MGNNIITISDDQLSEWVDLSTPIYERWVSDMAERGKDGQALIDRARELMAEYDATN